MTLYEEARVLINKIADEAMYFARLERTKKTPLSWITFEEHKGKRNTYFYAGGKNALNQFKEKHKGDFLLVLPESIVTEYEMREMVLEEIKRAEGEAA